jgi:hypothetical protein
MFMGGAGNNHYISKCISKCGMGEIISEGQMPSMGGTAHLMTEPQISQCNNRSEIGWG